MNLYRMPICTPVSLPLARVILMLHYPATQSVMFRDQGNDVQACSGGYMISRKRLMMEREINNIGSQRSSYIRLLENSLTIFTLKLEVSLPYKLFYLNIYFDLFTYLDKSHQVRSTNEMFKNLGNILVDERLCHSTFAAIDIVSNVLLLIRIKLLILASIKWNTFEM